MSGDRADRARSVPTPVPSLHVDVRVAYGDGGFALEAALEVPEGITILFGPSGAGKSTLLASIAGLIRPEKGSVRLGDETWFDASRDIDVPVHRRRVALLFQSLALFPHMTACENVAYGIARTVTRSARRDRAREGLERFRAAHLADRRPDTFSGGEAQRVALARAFAMRPHLVLLDEPFSAMDRELRRELLSLVPALAQELRVPVVHVTHHRDEARRIGDRAVILRDGRVVEEGPVEAVLAGAPPMTAVGR